MAVHPRDPMSPMLLRPLAKGRAWGGTTFVQWGKFAASDAQPQAIGEAWELCDLPETIPQGCSMIESGAHAGQSLRAALRTDERRIMGRAHLSTHARFPLLVKFLDAAEPLSVQVHPSPDFAAAHAHAHLKTESWFVLAAKPGARMWRGVRPEVTRDQFERALRAGADIVPMLVELPVRTGDCVDLPSGICHALGAGITVAEIQTPSDTTFRVFDWNRNDPARKLHLDEALACIAFGAEQALASIPVIHASEAPAILTRQFRTTQISRTPHYRIERLEALEGAELPIITHDRPTCWMVLSGSVRVEAPEPVVAGAWRTLLVPAAAEGLRAHLDAGTVILRASLPDPMDRWLA
jgi:mannose-6-phosphate isomerase